jgi:Enoyl-(Acyl carrier protein) reductase
VVNVTTTLVERANLAVPSALTSLTKGGLAAVMKSLAIEHARNGIRVNAISPSVVDTPMHADDAHAVFAGMHPLGRMGTIADIVQGVLYLETAVDLGVNFFDTSDIYGAAQASYDQVGPRFAGGNLDATWRWSRRCAASPTSWGCRWRGRRSPGSIVAVMLQAVDNPVPDGSVLP